MADPSTYPYTFDQESCESCGGRCCRWGGYVWVTEEEVLALAAALQLDLETFADQHLRAAYGRMSLQERLWEGEQLCSLFDPASGRCLVYAARPEQCRSFPFWESYRRNYRKLLAICPGVSEKK